VSVWLGVGERGLEPVAAAWKVSDSVVVVAGNELVDDDNDDDDDELERVLLVVATRGRMLKKSRALPSAQPTHLYELASIVEPVKKRFSSQASPESLKGGLVKV